MNKLDKKIMNLYIRSNMTKEFVNKKPSYQEILYFAKYSKDNDLTLLTQYVINTNDLDLIIDYAILGKNILPSDIKKIVDYVANSKNALYISRLLRNVEALDEKDITKLIQNLIMIKSFEEIIRIYVEVKNLSLKEKQNIIYAIRQSKNNLAITNFLLRSSDISETDVNGLIASLDPNQTFEYKKILKKPKLTDNSKKALVLKVLDSSDAKFIYNFIIESNGLYKKYANALFNKFIELKNVDILIDFYCNYLYYDETYENKIVKILLEGNDYHLIMKIISYCKVINKDNILLLQNKILESNDKLLIAKYLLITGNKALIINIFNDLMYFYFYCKDILKLDIEIEDFKQMLGINVMDERYNNYVDENIEKQVTRRL